MLRVKISKMRIFLFLLIGFCFSMEEHIEYFSKEKIIEYADYLFENDEYQMAINEYQRAYYISDNNHAGSVHERILCSGTRMNPR